MNSLLNEIPACAGTLTYAYQNEGVLEQCGVLPKMVGLVAKLWRVSMGGIVVSRLFICKGF